MPESATPSEFDTITWQLAMAFGQGAGTMLATPSAVSDALSPYRAYLIDNAGSWNDVALLFIEYSRALGTLSMVNAASRGAAVIDATDVKKALISIRSNKAFPLGPCNCLPPFREASLRGSRRAR
jgi:hypothetical protein